MDEGGAGVRVEEAFTGKPFWCLEEDLCGAVGLHLGCGDKRWPGWTNVDGSHTGADLICDLRQLPLASESVDRIAAIHVIEHFYKWEAGTVLLEWKRVLKMGGRLILELPSMDKIYLYIYECVRDGKLIEPRITSLAFWGDPGQELKEMHHKWGYNTKEMLVLLRKVGFKEAAPYPTRYHNPRRDMRIEAVK